MLQATIDAEVEVSAKKGRTSCRKKGEWAQKVGNDEILGSFFGPYLRSRVVWLRNMLGISYRKIPKIIEEMHGITFTPAGKRGTCILGPRFR